MKKLAPELSDLLRSCVQCGLCLPHCATYLASGNEVLSPRGRLVLLQEILADEQPVPDSYLAAFDQCIGCQACQTVCPSGVPYTLLAHGQQLAAARTFTTAPEPAVPAPILHRLDSPTFLRALGRAAGAARRLCTALWGPRWQRKLSAAPSPVARLARLLGSLPRSLASDEALIELLDGLMMKSNRPRPGPLPGQTNPEGARERLLFFSGCANAGLMAGTSRRLIAALETAGYGVEVTAGQDCCGALAAHTGRPARAQTLQERNQRAFGGAAAAGVPIVVEAAGCTLELKSYSPDFAARVTDAVSLLAAAPRPSLRPIPLRVVIHDPCHARHGLGISAEPRALLAAIPGLEWCEPAEKEVCCGSGGAWGLRFPEMSAALGRRKAQNLLATGADLVVTTNPGCLGQIADGLALEAPDLPILPLTDLWWYASRPDKK